MATVSLTANWLNITAEQSLADGSEYVAQARISDIEYGSFADGSAPGSDDTGFVLRRDDRPTKIPQKENSNIWARASRDSFPSDRALLKISA